MTVCCDNFAALICSEIFCPYLDLRFRKRGRHVVDERGQVLFAVAHRDEDAVEAPTDDDLFQLDDVLVPASRKNLDLANAETKDL